ncbi:MAG: 30S ribosomal protein S17 [Gammaproteobacteria bacterium]|nr:30S ribosomal protein S17 [Gammaproteobacteria bacterium]
MTVHTLVGVVTSDKMNKTRVVAVTRYVKHPLYGKTIKKTTKLYVHDEENACKSGDCVMVQESRPISKTKTWTFVKKVSKQ